MSNYDHAEDATQLLESASPTQRTHDLRIMAAIAYALLDVAEAIREAGETR